MDNKKNIEIPKMMYDLVEERERQMIASREQQRELYLANKKRLEKQKELKIEKKKLFKKNVERTVVAAALIAAGGLSVMGYQQFVGSERIANEFYQYTKEYGINNQSYGYVAIKNGEQISLDSAFYDMANDAMYDGMSFVKVCIATSKIFGNDLAKMYVGSVSFEERYLANLGAFYEGLAEEYGVELNDGKASGGIQR